MTFNPTLVKSTITLDSTELCFDSSSISMNNNKSQFTGNVMCLYDKGE